MDRFKKILLAVGMLAGLISAQHIAPCLVHSGCTADSTLDTNSILIGTKTSPVQFLDPNSAAKRKFVVSFSSGKPFYDTITASDAPTAEDSGTGTANTFSMFIGTHALGNTKVGQNGSLSVTDSIGLNVRGKDTAASDMIVQGQLGLPNLTSNRILYNSGSVATVSTNLQFDGTTLTGTKLTFNSDVSLGASGEALLYNAGTSVESISPNALLTLSTSSQRVLDLGSLRVNGVDSAMGNFYVGAGTLNSQANQNLMAGTLRVNGANDSILGNIFQEVSNAGTTTNHRLSNSSSTAGSDARLNILVGASTSGNPFTRYDVTGVSAFSTGINSQGSGTPLTISNGGVLGTTDILRMYTDQRARFIGTLSVAGKDSVSDATDALADGQGSFFAGGGAYITKNLRVKGTGSFQGLDSALAGMYVVGVTNTTTGYEVNGAASTGNVLRGNGTNFISATLGYSDLSGLPTLNGGSGIANSVAKWSAVNTLTFSKRSDDATLLIDSIKVLDQASHRTNGVDSAMGNFYVGPGTLNSAANQNLMTGSLRVNGAIDSLLGNVFQEASTSGGTVNDRVSNSSNTGSSDARLNILAAGSSGGNPFIRLDVVGATTFSMGMNNAATGDPFTISNGGTLGTTDLFILSTAGAYTFNTSGVFNIFGANASSETDLNIKGSRGTIASPTDVVNGDYPFTLQALAYSGGTYFNTAAIEYAIDGTFTSAQRPPSRIEFYTNKANTAQAIAMKIDNAGLVHFPVSWGMTTNIAAAAAAPTISSGFGSSPSVSGNNGTVAFEINVGTGGSASSGVIGLATAATGWNCFCTDITTSSATVSQCKQTASSTTTATIGNFTDLTVAAAWVASDKLRVSCFAF